MRHQTLIQSVCLCTDSSIHPPIHSSTNQPIHSHNHSSINPSIHPAIYTTIRPSTHPVIHPSIHQSIYRYLFVYLSVCMSLPACSYPGGLHHHPSRESRVHIFCFVVQLNIPALFPAAIGHFCRKLTRTEQRKCPKRHVLSERRAERLLCRGRGRLRMEVLLGWRKQQCGQGRVLLWSGKAREPFAAPTRLETSHSCSEIKSIHFFNSCWCFFQAPSSSLCISILELHSDSSACGRLILDLCNALSQKLVPVAPGIRNEEVDHNLVIRWARLSSRARNVRQLAFVSCTPYGTLVWLVFVDSLSYSSVWSVTCCSPLVPWCGWCLLIHCLIRQYDPLLAVPLWYPGVAGVWWFTLSFVSMIRYLLFPSGTLVWLVFVDSPSYSSVWSVTCCSPMVPWCGWCLLIHPLIRQHDPLLAVPLWYPGVAGVCWFTLLFVSMIRYLLFPSGTLVWLVFVDSPSYSSVWSVTCCSPMVPWCGWCLLIHPLIRQYDPLLAVPLWYPGVAGVCWFTLLFVSMIRYLLFPSGTLVWLVFVDSVLFVSMIRYLLFPSGTLVWLVFVDSPSYSSAWSVTCCSPLVPWCGWCLLIQSCSSVWSVTCCSPLVPWCGWCLLIHPLIRQYDPLLAVPLWYPGVAGVCWFTVLFVSMIRYLLFPSGTLVWLVFVDSPSYSSVWSVTCCSPLVPWCGWCLLIHPLIRQYDPLLAVPLWYPGVAGVCWFTLLFVSMIRYLLFPSGTLVWLVFVDSPSYSSVWSVTCCSPLVPWCGWCLLIHPLIRQYDPLLAVRLWYPGVAGVCWFTLLFVSMIRYLLFNAKLKTMKAGETQGVELCDTWVVVFSVCILFFEVKVLFVTAIFPSHPDHH